MDADPDQADLASRAILNKEREERIKVRRERIQAKIAARQSGRTGEALDKKTQKEQEKEERLQPRRGLDEVEKSRRRLARFAEEVTNEVTDVRVASDDWETQRRATEEALRIERRHKLLFEAENSARRNAAIAMKWNSLYDIQVPIELQHEMQAQQEACGRIMAAKNDLLREFQQALKAKDEQYVKALRKGVVDLDKLMDDMTNNTARQHELYEQELKSIELAFDKERSDLVAQCRKEWDDAFEKSLQQQLWQKEERQRRIDADRTKLLLVHRKDTEDFQTLKIRLETEKQNLEQQLEDMRATYQLNTEKLEYNFRVLHERNEENAATINANKRKLARLQDTLSNLVAKYAALDAQYRSENLELSEGYQRQTQLFMDLKDKLKHFQKLDRQRFCEVWDMHEAEVKRRLQRLLQADKIIHEQQLGLLWFPPSEAALNQAFATAREQALERVEARGGGTKTKGKGDAEGDRDPWEKEVSESEVRAMKDVSTLVVENTHFLQDARASGPTTTAERPADTPESPGVTVTRLESPRPGQPDPGGGPPTGEELQEALGGVPREGGNFMQLRKVLKVLGISSAKDIRLFMAFLTAGDGDPAAAAAAAAAAGKGGDEGGDEGRNEGDSELTDLVGEEQVVSAVKAFLEFRRQARAEAVGQRRDKRAPASATDSAAAVAGPASFDETVATLRTMGGGGAAAAVASRGPDGAWKGGDAGPASISALASVASGAGGVAAGAGGGLGGSLTHKVNVWALCEQVVPQDTLRVWSELERFQARYNRLLKARAQAIEDTTALQTQNTELKMLLNQYLTSQVNGQLYVPPTATISRM